MSLWLLLKIGYGTGSWTPAAIQYSPSFVIEQGRASGLSRNVIGPQPSAWGAAAALVAAPRSVGDFCSAQPFGWPFTPGQMGASCEAVIQQLLLTDVQDCT